VYHGGLLHHLLHALDPATHRSCAATQLSVEADSTWTRSIEDSTVSGRSAPSYRIFRTCWLWNLSARPAHSGMVTESTGWSDGIATQATPGKKIGSASDRGDRRNREAGLKQCGE